MQGAEDKEQAVLPVLVTVQVGLGILHEGQPKGAGAVMLAVPVREESVCIHEVVLLIGRTIDNAVRRAMLTAQQEADKQRGGGQEGGGDGTLVA